MSRNLLFAALAPVLALGVVAPASAQEQDKRFFKSVVGEWSGPGEIVAGKYKGTRFTCNFKGSTPGSGIGMTLDGGCRVGMFTQRMSASFERRGRQYRGTFMDGAAGKGLDITSGRVDGRRVTLALNRNALNGAMLARLANDDTMNVTVSVRVNEELVPVIGVNLKRVDASTVGSLSE